VVRTDLLDKRNRYDVRLIVSGYLQPYLAAPHAGCGDGRCGIAAPEFSEDAVEAQSIDRVD
jgi:hypothetical protein